MSTALRRIFYLLGASALLVMIGTAGFVLIEDWPVFDAFYMTVFTITTVGYSELHALSQAGRIFNIILILVGVSLVFFGIGLLTQTIVEFQFQEEFGRRKNKKMIDKLKDHYVICGFGRVGRGAAEQFKRTHIPFVVVDRDRERVEKARRLNMLAIDGDITQDEVLEEVGIRRARGLVAALATDADNVFLILSAKMLNPGLNIAARVANEETENRMRLAGADVVLAPYASTGHRLAQSLIRPHVVEFLELPGATAGSGVSLEQVKVAENSAIASRTIEESNVRRDYGVIVLGVRRADGQMVFNPSATTRIEANDYLIVMGEPKGLRGLEAALGQGEARPA